VFEYICYAIYGKKGSTLYYCIEFFKIMAKNEGVINYYDFEGKERGIKYIYETLRKKHILARKKAYLTTGSRNTINSLFYEGLLNDLKVMENWEKKPNGKLILELSKIEPVKKHEIKPVRRKPRIEQEEVEEEVVFLE